MDAGGTLKVDNTGQKLDELKNLVAWQTGELKKAYKEKQAPVVNIINNNNTTTTALSGPGRSRRLTS